MKYPAPEEAWSHPAPKHACRAMAYNTANVSSAVDRVHLMSIHSLIWLDRNKACRSRRGKWAAFLWIRLIGLNGFFGFENREQCIVEKAWLVFANLLSLRIGPIRQEKLVHTSWFLACVTRVSAMSLAWWKQEQEHVRHLSGTWQQHFIIHRVCESHILPDWLTSARLPPSTSLLSLTVLGNLSKTVVKAEATKQL